MWTNNNIVDPHSSLGGMAPAAFANRPRHKHEEIEANLSAPKTGSRSDNVRISPLPNASTALTSLAGWIEDYNGNHPHSGPKMRSPREHRALASATA